MQRAARGSVWNLLGSGVSGVATFLLTVAVTRLASQTEAGIFFSATSLFLMVTSLGQLGANTGIVYFLSGARARGELHHATTYMRTAIRPVLVVAVVLAAALFLLADPLESLLSPGANGGFADYMRLMALFVPCAAVLNIATSGTRGLGTMKPTAALDQMTRPVLQLVLVGVLLTLLGPGAISWAWSLAYLPTAVLAWWWWKRLRERAAPQVIDPTFRPAGAFWRFSAPRALAGVAQVAMQRLDIILVGALAGLEAAAIYGAATRFLALGQMVGRAVSLSVQPLLGESLAHKDYSGTAHLYQASTAWLVLATWPLYLVLLNFGGTVLGIFGDGYSMGDSALLILCAAMLVATACGMVDMVLIMAGRSFWNLTNVLIALATNISLDFLLIPSHGVLGAAVGWAAALLLGNLLPLAQVFHWFRLHPFGGATLLAIAASAVPFGLLPLALGAVLSGGAHFVTSLALGFVVYGGALFLLRRQLQLGVLVSALRKRKAGRKQSFSST
nr:lipopolysaccharide biosynthesis protein [Ornithinimicrobium sp. HY1793]